MKNECNEKTDQLHPIDGQKENTEVKTAGQGFSVNGMYGIPAGTSSSSGKQSGPAYLVQEGQLLATLSFYGFADKNHMPLRRIAIGKELKIKTEVVDKRVFLYRLKSCFLDVCLNG